MMILCAKSAAEKIALKGMSTSVIVHHNMFPRRKHSLESWMVRFLVG